MKRPATNRLTAPRRVAIGFIRLYQRTLSPDHGPLAPFTNAGCRYWPSCSEYTAQAIAHYGVMQGSARGAWRILRCNPWSVGGIDEPVLTSKAEDPEHKE